MIGRRTVVQICSKNIAWERGSAITYIVSLIMLSPVSLLDYFGGYHSLALSSDDDCKRTGGAVLGSRNDSNVPKIPADQPNAHYYAVPDELIISHIPLSMQTPGVLARKR